MENAVALLNKGLALAKEEKFKQSVDVLNTIPEADIPPETKKLVLFQMSVCYMMLEEYTSAERTLLEYIKIGEDKDVYELLTSVYDILKNSEKSLGAYERLLALDPANARAMLNVIAYQDRSGLKKTIETLEYMHYLIDNNKLSGHPHILLYTAFNAAVAAANRLTDTDSALKFFNAYAGLLTPEEKKIFTFYHSLLAAVFSSTIYSTYNSHERQIEMMWEMYDLFNPQHINTLSRDISCFREINIGFLSNDLRFHPIGRFLLALFEGKAAFSGVNYFCYDTKPEPPNDVVTEQLKLRSDKFISIGHMTDDEAEEVILNDNLDILFDLNGVSLGNKRELVMRRLAPVQLTWIGFPCTAAIKNADYIIVDYVTDPVGYAHKFYTEKPVYMSKTFLCYPLMYLDENALLIKEPPLVKNGFITFGTFNNAAKYTGEMISAWARVLELLPAARLMVVSSNSSDEVSQWGLREKYAKTGIDMQRVDFTEPKGFAEYLPMYNEVDIILDTFPFNGATTTCDALMMGVPVVSLYGVSHLERVGLDMLGLVGLSDLAVSTYDEYVETAVKLANDKQRLIDLKKTLRDAMRRSPLSDTGIFKTEFENLMRRLYINYCAENEKKPNTASDMPKVELFHTVMRGLYFFKNLFYDSRDGRIIDYAKAELLSLQDQFFKIIAGDIHNDDVLKSYKKIVRLFSGHLQIDDLKAMVDMCEKLVIICAGQGGLL